MGKHIETLGLSSDRFGCCIMPAKKAVEENELTITFEICTHDKFRDFIL